MTARLMTADEVVAAMIELTQAGEVVPVWSVEYNDIGFWPATEVPPNAEPLSTEQVRAHFERRGPGVMPGLN